MLRRNSRTGYIINPEGVKFAEDKIKAIQVWPEALESATHVRQFLGTVSYCHMFMGSDYAVVARSLVNLTQKGVIEQSIWFGSQVVSGQSHDIY